MGRLLTTLLLVHWGLLPLPLLFHSGSEEVLAPQIDDWRAMVDSAMVDSVMIDPAYDGQVFKVALADVPERKGDLVAGEYELEAPESETTVAVKVTDMLGEEVMLMA